MKQPAVGSRRGIRHSIALAALLLGACSGRGALRGQEFSGPDLRYTLGPIPKHWRAVSLTGNDVAMRDGKHHATLAIDSTCDAHTDAPLIALTRHLFIGLKKLVITAQNEVMLDGRAALVSAATGTLDGVAIALEVVVTVHGRCSFDFEYSTTARHAGEAHDAFTQMWRGFHLVRSPGEVR